MADGSRSWTMVPELPPDTVWQKAAASAGNGNCVELACRLQGRWAGKVAVRDSKCPNGTALLFSGEAFGRFVEQLKG